MPLAKYTLTVKVIGDCNPAAAATDGETVIDAFELVGHPDTDTDEDGLSDADEAIAGTNPYDPASCLAITNGYGSGFVVEWPAVSNRQYQVYRADNPTHPFNAVGPLLHFPQNSYTDSVPHSTSFYKVGVTLQ